MRNARRFSHLKINPGLRWNSLGSFNLVRGYCLSSRCDCRTIDWQVFTLRTRGSLFVSAAGLASLVAAIFVGRRYELAVGAS